MPGPASTESLCALTTTVRSGSPNGESAMTLFVVRVSEMVFVTMCHVTVCPARIAFTASTPNS
jgi:hypothetical protein